MTLIPVENLSFHRVGVQPYNGIITNHQNKRTNHIEATC